MGDQMTASSENDCGWKVIEGFDGEDDYDRLKAEIRKQVDAGRATEEPVRKPYSGVDWDEHWYRCRSTRSTWRLVAPDPPFRGLFKPV